MNPTVNGRRPDPTPRWGTDIVRSEGAIPFRCYSPRPRRVPELLRDAARWSGREHLIQGSRRLSFGDVFDAIDRVAAELGIAGLRPGDRLLLLMPNSPEWVVTLWAALKLGAIVALGNGWWSAAEVRHAIETVTPSLVVADPKRAALLPTDANTLGVDIIRTWVDQTVEHPTKHSGPASLSTGYEQPGVAEPNTDAGQDEAGEDDPAVIVFTAGTTGAPKPVVLAHRSIIANLHNLLVMSGRLPHQIDESHQPAISLQSGPLFHIGGLQSLLLALLGGNTLVFLEGRFDPEQVLDVIERERVTWWGAVPTMASRVLAHPRLAQRDLSSVRSVSMGGAPILPELVARLREAFPNAVKGMSTIYGMTETGGTVAAANGRTMAAHPLTAGAPLPVVELRIDDPDSDGEGEIVVRTPGQMIGYWGISGASDSPVDDEGFVHTGDLGRLVDGLLYVTGRIKDLIIRGGENVAPAHVESALLRHPAVVNAAVIGRPDPDWGERVAAVVQIDPACAVSEDELAKFTAGALARFEVPELWWLRTEPLPMHDSGKTDKATLKADWPD